MDDGTPHTGKRIHSVRVPVLDPACQIVCEDIKALHYQCIDPARVLSKQRWYHRFGRVRNPRVSTAKISDQYHHVDRLREEDFVKVDPQGLRGYQEWALA